MESIPPLLHPPVNRRRWWIHLLLIVGYIAFAGISGWRRGPSQTPALSHSITGLLWVCAFQLLVFGLVFGLAYWASRATRDELRLRWRGTYQPPVFGLVYSIGLRLAIAVVMFVVALALVAFRVMTPDALKSFAISHRPDVEALVDVDAMRHNPVYYWFTLTIVSFVVAALREELWRSAFLAGLGKLWPRWFGSQRGQIGSVFIVACFFGMAHGAQGGLAMVMAGLLGVGLGMIMVMHRSIWPAVIAHGFFDATTFAVLPWALKHTV